jgi:hypothetical protein
MKIRFYLPSMKILHPGLNQGSAQADTMWFFKTSSINSGRKDGEHLHRLASQRIDNLERTCSPRWKKDMIKSQPCQEKSFSFRWRLPETTSLTHAIGIGH